MRANIRELPVVIVTSNPDRARIVVEQFTTLKNCKPLIRVLDSPTAQIDLPNSQVANLSIDVTDGLGESTLIDLLGRFNVERTSFFSQDCFDQVKNHCGILVTYGY